MRPTWAEVSIPALRRNFRLISQHVGADVTVCAVVKADAYGHGAVECARALEREGAEWFGVTSTEEGVALRLAGVDGRILLMTGFWRGEEDEIVGHSLTPAVWQRDQVQRLERAAAAANTILPVHVKVETGMARLGAGLAQLPALVEALRSAPHLTIEGLFTHLASAEVVNAPDVEAQAARFAEAERLLARSGLKPRYVHMANSAAIVAYPGLRRNFVRPGISLYGYYLPFTRPAEGGPATPDSIRGLPVEPVLSWKTRILALRDVPAGQAIGYSGAYVSRSPARIAALPLGYADGLSRQLSSAGRVIVGGRFAPIVGNVSMDITLADVSGIEGTAVGDEVTLIGRDGNCTIDAWEAAGLARTIPYEVLCGISKRVPRRYVQDAADVASAG